MFQFELSVTAYEYVVYRLRQGPATYGAANSHAILPNNGGFTIKSRVPYNDDPICNPKSGPGPAAYDPLERRKSSRGFSMGIRHSPYLMPVISSRDTIW